MEKEIVGVLKVETGDSEKTIKALKEEIKNLKTTLEGAEIGSDKFAQTSKELADAQSELKTALDSTKEKVKSADGSYNALVATMAELKKEWRATGDEAERSNIGDQISEINTKLKELDATIGNNQRNVGNYKQDIVDAFSEMKEESFDFGKTLGEVNKETEISRNAFDGVGKVASGVASGFAAVQGVTALLGIENSNLEKSLVKVQSAMAIAQGIGGLKGLIEGFSQLKTVYTAVTMGSKALQTQTVATSTAMTGSAVATKSATVALQGFKGALISTGVGALVVALGTLIQYLIDLKDEAEEATTALAELDEQSQANARRNKWNDTKEDTRILKEYIKAVEEANGDTEKLRKAEADYNAKVAENALQDAQRAYDNTKNLYEEASEKYRLEKEKANSSIKYKDKMSKEELDELFNKVLELEVETAEAEKRIYEIKAKNAQDSANKLFEIEKEEKKKAEENAKKNAETAKKNFDTGKKYAEEARKTLINTKNEELAELERVYLEKKALLEKEGLDTANLTAVYEKESEAIIKKYNDIAEAQKKAYSDKIVKELKKSLDESDKQVSAVEQEVEIKYTIKGLDNTNAIEDIQNEIDKTLELQRVREQAYNEQMAQIQSVLESNKLSIEKETELRQKLNAYQNQKIEERKVEFDNGTQNEIDKTLELQRIKEQAYNEQMQLIQDVLDKNKLTIEQQEKLKELFNELQYQKEQVIQGKEVDNSIVNIQLEIDKTLELQAVRERAFDEQMAQIQAVLDANQLTAEQEDELKKRYLEIQAQKVEETEKSNAIIAQLNQKFLDNQLQLIQEALKTSQLTTEKEEELRDLYAEIQAQKLAETANVTTQIAVLNKQALDAQKAQNEAYAKSLTTTFTSALQSTSNVLASLQSGIDTTNKEGFEKNKKLQVANATIGMLVGITNALSGAFTTKSGPWDLVLAGIQAASIATSGGIQIANINKQRYDGGSDTNVGVTPNINMASSMPIQYTRELMTNSEMDSINQPTKVYVLESEIQEAHTRVQVKENNTSF